MRAGGAVEENIGDVHSVQLILGGVPSRHGQQGGGYVHGGAGLVDDLSPGNVAGPAEDSGHPNAALKEAELMSLQTAGLAAVVGIAPAVHPVPGFPGGAVVALEENHRILQNPLALQLVHDLTYAVVHRAEHGRHDPPVRRQLREPVQILPGGMHGVVGSVIGNIQEEGLLLPVHLPDLLHRLVRDHFGEVFAVVIEFVVVLPQVMGGVRLTVGHGPVENMGVIINAAGHEAVEIVKAVLVGAALLLKSQMPLTHDCRLIPQFLDRGRNGGHLGSQPRGLPVARQNGPDTGVAGVAARQQGRPGGRTHRAARIPVGEPCSLLCHRVNIGRPEIGVPHA